MISEAESLPYTKTYRYQPWPEHKGRGVEFRLIYRGILPAQQSDCGERGSRKKEKHDVRKEFHKQLAVLWKKHAVLSQWLTKKQFYEVDGVQKLFVFTDKIIEHNRDWGFNWLPLVTDELGLACSLDILFLRRDGPGGFIKDGGDIDNRLKVLFDGLRRPRHIQEIEGFAPDPSSENPFFCLLEDDKLISEVRVTTDRLLTPVEAAEHEHDVVLVIHVKTIVVDPTRAYLDLAF